ncbi:MAG: hypothetical protein ACTTJ6_00575 [Treponema sp.]
MRKNLCVAIGAMIALVSLSLFAQTVKPKTTEYPVQGRKDAVIKMTEIYKNEYWVEFYLVYEEPTRTFDEAATEKAIYEFLSNYKRDNVFARVEIEDLKAATTGAKNTTVEKRVIFRNLRK